MNTDQSSNPDTSKLGDAAQRTTDANIWSRFTQIETERFLYAPSDADKTPLVGYLLNTLDMPPIGKGEKERPWKCFLVKTTEEAIVRDREKEPIMVKAGSEVLVPATYQLAQHFQIPAADPDRCWEVIIEPKKKIDIGGGQTMWTFNLGWNPRNAQRREAFGFPAKLGALPPGPSNAPQLADGKTITTDGVPVSVEAAGRTVTAEKIPF